VEHAPVLPFELELVLFALFVLVELPGAVDGPVAEGAVAKIFVRVLMPLS
jgi:hypothetical protein